MMLPTPRVPAVSAWAARLAMIGLTVSTEPPPATLFRAKFSPDAPAMVIASLAPFAGVIVTTLPDVLILSSLENAILGSRI